MSGTEQTSKAIAIPLEFDRQDISIDPLPAIIFAKREKEFVKILVEYEAILQSSLTPQEIVDNTNLFLKELVGSECACVRSAENNRELVFKTVSCPHAKRENRAYELERITIITSAARRGVSILETDQKDNKENGRPETDSGSLMTVTLPLSENLHSPRLQLTTCDFRKPGMFDLFHATVANFILRRMTDAYLARRYSALHPIITKSAMRMDPVSRHRIFGSSLFETDLGGLINELHIAHNTAYLIDNVSAWPKFLHTEGVVGRDTEGRRPYQQEILEKLQNQEQGIFVVQEGDKLKIHRRINPYVDELELTESWPEGLSVAVVPLTFETEFLGYLWLERENEAFEASDLEKLEQRIVREPSELLVKAVEKVGRPRVHFVALPSNPKMKAVLDKIHLATQNPKANIILSGETGTGKELVARIIHDESRNRFGRYVAVDAAAAISREFSSLLLGRGSKNSSESKSGLFRLATGGTLILDQLESYPADSRAALLRTLEENEYQPFETTEKEPLDARVIGIVTGNLTTHLNEGRITQDVLTRLGNIKIEMPPLRDRTDEIEIILEHWLRIGELSHFNGKYVHKTIIEAFKRYSWPGNMRDLRNEVEAMCINAGPDVTELTAEHLDSSFVENLRRAGISIGEAEPEKVVTVQ